MERRWMALRRGVIVFVIVGTWEGSELFDRLVAYAILSIGGPSANSISHEIARELGIGSVQVAGFRRLWDCLVGYAWWPDARGTIRAGREFIERYLDEFVRHL